MSASNAGTDRDGNAVVVRYVAHGVGAVLYTPQRAAADTRWGPYEVHPQREPIECDGVVSLEYVGDWVALPPPGGPSFVFPMRWGGRESAERMAAMQNGDAPTRVVEIDGTESTSRHTAASVRAELPADVR